MFKINYKQVTPPIENVEVTLTVEEIRLIRAALGPTTLQFTDSVGVIDGYDLWEKIGNFIDENKIENPDTFGWCVNRNKRDS